MASVLKVDKLDPQSGTALEIGTSGDTITVPSGATLDISSATLTPPATMPASSGINFTALNASNLGSGTVPTARLGSGTASSSTVLYGDQTYKIEPTGGKVLQVIQFTMASFVTTSSTSYVDFSSMLVTITPSATTSKILLIHAAPSTCYCDNNTNMANVALFRDTTNITTLGHNTSFASYQKTDYMEGTGITYLDSPSSTSAIEYRVKCKVDNASLQFVYGSYFTAGSQPRQSSLIAMEIGA